jgi:hypothetical protein
MKKTLFLCIFCFVATTFFAQNDTIALKQDRERAEKQPLAVTKNYNCGYIGLTYHNYAGRLGNHLGNGVGLKLRCNIVREENWGIGLTGTISFNQRKQKFERDSAYSDFYNMTLIGINYIHRLYQNKNHDLNLQADLCVVPGSTNQVPNGASIGVLFNYAYHKKLEYRAISDFWESHYDDAVVADGINFHAGIHAILTGSQMEGSGLMFDVGISHRFSHYFKDDTPEQKAAKKAQREREKAYVYIPPPKPFAPKYEDFEYIEIKQPFHIQAGITSDILLGGLNEYYGIGIGGNMAFGSFIQNGWGLGFGMSVAQNSLKQLLPVEAVFQEKNATKVILGGFIEKSIYQTDKTQLIAELGGYAVNQFTEIRVKNTDTLSRVSHLGFAPALTLNYAVRLGTKTVNNYTIRPSLSMSYINFYTTIRPVSFPNGIAAGTQIEVGATYRFTDADFKIAQLKSGVIK